MNNVKLIVRKDLNAADTAASCCVDIRYPIRVAPRIPSIEPTAPPIKVLSEALRIRVSKKTIRMMVTSNRIWTSACHAIDCNLLKIEHSKYRYISVRSSGQDDNYLVFDMEL